jgi:hypothetical protein
MRGILSFDADPDPTFHFDADPEDQDPTPSFTHVRKSGNYFYCYSQQGQCQFILFYILSSGVINVFGIIEIFRNKV